MFVTRPGEGADFWFQHGGGRTGAARPSESSLVTIFEVGPCLRTLTPAGRVTLQVEPAAASLELRTVWERPHRSRLGRLRSAVSP